MKSHDFDGVITKANEVYTIRDNTTLDTLVVSQTILHVNQCTSGHYHDNTEEVYFFMYGIGEMVCGDRKFEVSSGSIILIPFGQFHKVWNRGESDLVFNCVFTGKRNH
jgi:mannose-6-phosphate isomerase-like protein (cupin superfamily)